MSLYLGITDLRQKEKIIILYDSKTTHAFKKVYVLSQTYCDKNPYIYIGNVFLDDDDDDDDDDGDRNCDARANARGRVLARAE